jgi:hypothetical protein
MLKLISLYAIYLATSHSPKEALTVVITVKVLEGQSTILVTCQALHGSLHTQSRPLLRVRLRLKTKSRQPMIPNLTTGVLTN